MRKIIDRIDALELSSREYFFVGMILFLIGLVIGLVVSPKGERMIGSNNGNNNGNNNSSCLTEGADSSDCEG